MPKSETRKKQKPASSRGVPVLSILFGLLFAALAALGGWLYWSDSNKDHTSLSAAITDITPPQTTTEEQTTKQDTVKEEENLPVPKETVADAPTPDAHEAPDPHKKPVSPEPPEPSETVEKIDNQDAEEITGAAKEIPQPTVSAPLIPHSDQEPVAGKEATGAEAPKTESIPVETAKESAHPPAEEKTISTSALDEKPKAIEPEKTTESQPVKEPAEEKKAKPQIRVIAAPEPATPLAPAPDPELTKKSDFGLLPVVGPTGRQPWRIYARPFDDPLDRPRIAIIISEMGMSTSATRSAIQNLQGSISLSFNPYARDLQSWIGQARAAGHEVLLQLPMEPFGYPKNDPGPHSLLTSLTDRENLNRLDWMLGRFTGYSGVTNQMGSKFTAKADYIRPVLEVIKSRGLLFVDGRTSAKSVAGQLASKIDVPVAINNRFLDHKADRGTIDARLKDLERIARYTGTAVGIGYPYPVTLERIAAWSKTLARKGYVLAPVSAVINRQEIQ